jgi:hypothetical protein
MKATEQTILATSTLILLIITLIAFQQTIPTSFLPITGKTTTTVNITPAPPIPCNFTLYNNTNLVSIYCIPNAIPTTWVMSNLTNLTAVYAYRTSGQDRWKVYNPAMPNWTIQDLDVMSRLEGYYITMTADELFSEDGGLRLPNNVPLVPGWNLVGYPTNKTKDVNTSFQSIAGNFTEVRTYNETLGIYINYIPGLGGAINTTVPFKGYWINVTVDEVWYVD